MSDTDRYRDLRNALAYLRDWIVLHQGDDQRDNTGIDRYGAVLDEMEDLLSSWHPIEDGLPEVNEQGYREVIITDGDERSVGIYLEGRDYISPANSSINRRDITHFMYYPPFPDDR